MKQVLNRIAIAALAMALMLPVTLMAQKEEVEKVKEKERKEVEQIIITLKGDKKEKVTVEVNGDNITINGKPLSEYKDGDISVNRHKIRDRLAVTAPYTYNYNFNNGNGLSFFSGDENRAMLGVTTEKTEQGVEVQEITKESAAEKAGLKKGDIITKIDETKISDPDGLSDAITKHKPGDKVSVTFLRDKKEQKVSAELTKWKGIYSFRNHDFGLVTPDLNLKLDDLRDRVKTIPRADMNGQIWQMYSGARPKLGLSVQDTEDGKGVKVIEVDAEGTAKKAGIKENDLITEVDGKAVNSADEMAKIVRESKDKASFMVKLQRDGKTQNIEVKIPKKLKTADL